jgi:hypothetical protein
MTSTSDHVLAKLDVGVGLEKLAAFRRVIKFFPRHQLDADAFALAQNPPVLGRRLELREIYAHLAAQIKPVEVARRRQEAGVKNIRRRLAGLRQRPDGIRKLVVLVVGVLFGEKEFHKFNLTTI